MSKEPNVANLMRKAEEISSRNQKPSEINRDRRDGGHTVRDKDGRPVELNER